MIPFLKQTADHFMSKGNISKLCFIFPNRRSQVFFTKYLGEAVKESGKPIFSPKMYTINDFFFKISGVKPADRVNLLLELYDCYKALKADAEPLDDFIFWGDVILGDFDDVDKYLVDPEKLFRNVTDFKSIKDSYEYLTDAQKTAIENFMRHFDKGFSAGEKKLDVKENFVQIWNLLFPLYNSFRSNLEAKGMAYEGMVYRSLAERMKSESAVDVLKESFDGTDGFVFVGLNALNECEKTVMRRMRDAGLASFCWDYSSDMIKDRLNKSSFFMRKNVEEFPPCMRIDEEGLKVPQVEVISVPSSVGQAKLIPSYVKSEDYAIVLPDETLLVPVLNSIDPEIKNINVTMGYPMKDSAFFDFLSLVSTMQMHLRQKDGNWLFYHKQVWSIFSSSIFRKLTGGDKAAAAIVHSVKSRKQFYIPQEDLSGSPVLDLIFRPAVTDMKSADASQISSFADYQKSLIKGLAPMLADDPALAIELEFARLAYNSVTRLQAKKLEILPTTYLRLLDQLLGPVSVPFNGEPLKGLQIMGPLETRALDFKHVIILSCNEGVFPHRSVSSSFIPPELRKGFSLPTYEFQDAVWAYYFYRLIQRAETVTLVYDSRTEGLKNGEESRYIKQLEYHFNVPLKRSYVKAEASLVQNSSDIPKTQEDVDAIRNTTLSASALKGYLDCPAKFYYSKVKKLYAKDEVSEDLDAGMFGDVYHETMETLYKGDYVTIDQLKGYQKSRDMIKDLVRSKILEQVKYMEVTGRDLVAENVIVEYVLKTIQKDIALLEKSGSDRFEMIGVENEYRMDIEGFHFYGRVDRIDSCRPGEVRIIDYKTGKVGDSDVNIDDSNAQQIVEDLFGPDNEKRPKIAFQIFLYDILTAQDPNIKGKRVVNVIYPPAELFSKDLKEVPANAEFIRLTSERLKTLLAEMVSLEIPFKRTNSSTTCSMCDFKMICGR